MSLCKNLFNTFIEYLDIKDIMNLSLTSKANYQLVNENNPKVNSRWREECNKNFCDNETQEIMDEYYNIKYHNQDNEIINSEINWKGLFMVMKNQQKGLNKNLYGDTNLVKTVITYNGTSYDGKHTGYVSLSERQSKFIYQKYYFNSKNIALFYLIFLI